MGFRVVDGHSAPSSEDEILLVRDGWNDWYVWYTQFSVVVAPANMARSILGSVKIGQIGMTRERARTQLPERFDRLDETYFSIGQSENYYETLNTLGEKYRDWLLVAMRDCARDLGILDSVANEPVLGQSLLRDIDGSRVRHRFHRLANGNTVLTPYAFRYAFPLDTKASSPPPILTFRVRPGSMPPSNVHVLIGRNGVGKTRCFDGLARCLLAIPDADGDATGELTTMAGLPTGSDHGFAGLVTVSFSAFDRYGPLVAKSGVQTMRYEYVGLIKDVAPGPRLDPSTPSPPDAPATQTDAAPSIKSRDELVDEFVASVGRCREGARRTRWHKALRTLEGDPLFEEIDVTTFAAPDATDWEADARRRFRRLSSGHSVVLLTITRLVELVEESSLVLIDEPESHLHPPLLSAFVRALSDLLVDRNGVAIVATHSPVVLQEVPRECCWILNRSGRETRADRPELESFGENVGTITREVFGLEVVQTGFHRLIAEAAIGRSYPVVLQLFSESLGAEARILARTMTLLDRRDGTTED